MSRLDRIGIAALAVIAANVLGAKPAMAAVGPGYCEGLPICIVEGVCESEQDAYALCTAVCGAGVQWAMCFHWGACGGGNDFEAVACYT